jgi:predicted transcriptional regulator
MQHLTLRVEEELAEQLRQLADEEQESISTTARRVLRRGLRTLTTASGRTESLARAHEGSGRVR